VCAYHCMKLEIEISQTDQQQQQGGSAAMREMASEKEGLQQEK